VQHDGACGRCLVASEFSAPAKSGFCSELIVAIFAEPLLADIDPDPASKIVPVVIA
jgi:hypothetical protein